MSKSVHNEILSIEPGYSLASLGIINYVVFFSIIIIKKIKKQGRIDRQRKTERHAALLIKSVALGMGFRALGSKNRKGGKA